MNQLSLIPVCEEHGIEKVWIKDKSNRNGGFYRCRECNRLRSLERNARNRANPKKTAQLNADAARRYHAQPQEKKDARQQQVIAQRVERFEQDPAAGEAYRESTNANTRARRAKIPAHVHRENNLKKNYGMTQADYDKLLESQNGGCAICGSKESGVPRIKQLFVDHCHETDQVRGLLCHQCNAGLGNYSDDISKLESAIRYLNEANMGRNARGAA